MEDAQALFREGVLALKEQRDAARARQLITQSLKLDPNNEMAWLWLSRTTDDPAKKLQCVERALKINPANEQALTLREKLRSTSPTINAPAPPASPAASPPPASKPPTGRSIHDRIQSASAEVHHPPPLSTPPAVPESPPARALRKPAYIQEEPVHDLVTEDQLRLSESSKTLNDKLTPDEERRIQKYLAAAEARLAAEDEEAAIEQWVYALQIQVDHPQAIQRAVRQLFQMKYTEDAQELLQRAIQAGTPALSIYMTAIDLHRHLGNYTAADDLRDKVVMMESADDETILKIVDGLINDVQASRAMELLEKAINARPENHDLLMRMGNILEDQGRKNQAMRYYERAARATNAKGRKRADQVLQTFTPIITDQERGSILLALREAAGVGVAFLLLAWQDSGLNLLRVNLPHWGGVLLSLLGGYFVVTAFSSPQQKGLAAFFGGRVPEEPEGSGFQQEVEVKPWEEDVAMPAGPLQDPTDLPILPGWARFLFATLGIAILCAAFYLAFGNAIQLLLKPVTPPLPNIYDFVVPTGE